MYEIYMFGTIAEDFTLISQIEVPVARVSSD